MSGWIIGVVVLSVVLGGGLCCVVLLLSVAGVVQSAVWSLVVLLSLVQVSMLLRRNTWRVELSPARSRSTSRSWCRSWSRSRSWPRSIAQRVAGRVRLSISVCVLTVFSCVSMTTMPQQRGDALLTLSVDSSGGWFGHDQATAWCPTRTQTGVSHVEPFCLMSHWYGDHTSVHKWTPVTDSVWVAAWVSMLGGLCGPGVCL